LSRRLRKSRDDVGIPSDEFGLSLKNQKLKLVNLSTPSFQLDNPEGWKETVTEI